MIAEDNGIFYQGAIGQLFQAPISNAAPVRPIVISNTYFIFNCVGEDWNARTFYSRNAIESYLKRRLGQDFDYFINESFSSTFEIFHISQEHYLTLTIRLFQYPSASSSSVTVNSNNSIMIIEFTQEENEKTSSDLFLHIFLDCKQYFTNPTLLQSLLTSPEAVTALPPLYNYQVQPLGLVTPTIDITLYLQLYARLYQNISGDLQTARINNDLSRILRLLRHLSSLGRQVGNICYHPMIIAAAAASNTATIQQQPVLVLRALSLLEQVMELLWSSSSTSSLAELNSSAIINEIDDVEADNIRQILATIQLLSYPIIAYHSILSNSQAGLSTYLIDQSTSSSSKIAAVVVIAVCWLILAVSSS